MSQHTKPAVGHIPFAGHRTVAQWDVAVGWNAEPPPPEPKAFECWGCVEKGVCPFRGVCPKWRDR